MARQHPLLQRTDEDYAYMTKAQEKQARRAAKRAALASEIKPTGKPGPEFSGAEQRRLEKRARKVLP